MAVICWFAFYRRKAFIEYRIRKLPQCYLVVFPSGSKNLEHFEIYIIFYV